VTEGSRQLCCCRSY